MSEYTQAGKPLISIVMAIYEPRLDWLREQLFSLNIQTYPNLKLYIRDDCSKIVPYEQIVSCAAECIIAFPYEIRRNEKNLGSNGTFELLTKEAQGDLIAYCDQDDRWLPGKLERLAAELGKTGAAMAYSDLAVMDGNGRLLASSLRELRPRLRYISGTGLEESYFFRNCTAGCSMLIRSETAKRAAPFPAKTVCDHWLSILAALDGPVAFVDAPLLYYRLHRDNQTGVLKGVSSKADYRENRLLPLRERLLFYKRYAQPSPALYAFLAGRLRGRVSALWKYRSFSPKEAAFEIALKFMPDWVFRMVIHRLSYGGIKQRLFSGDGL